jgi:hypothetical protein
MKLWLIAVCLVSAVVATADTWTNRLGRTFSAKLIGVDDKGATFVFAEDGATNILPLVKLSKDSALRACDLFGFAPVPPRLAATFNRATSDLKRITDLQEDGVLTAEKAAHRRTSVIKAFSDICREKGIASDMIERLARRLSR